MKKNRNTKSQFIEPKGFTLIELILVLVLLGVMAVGISGFMKIATQTYINVSDRDELLSSARFVVERLNREIRNAIPNSIRVAGNQFVQCIEFAPIKASTYYTDIPVSPDLASNQIKVVKFRDSEADYECNGCRDRAIVYPLHEDEVYDISSDSAGKAANIGDFTPPASGDEWTIPLLNSSFLFDEESPTKRIYIGNNQISYCLAFGGVYRYDNSLGGAQIVPPPSSNVLMAEYINFNDSTPAFIYEPATLKRNALVQVRLHFTKNEESYVYENEIHIENVP